MTLPAEDPDNDTEESSPDRSRPDWLRGMDEEIGSAPGSRAPSLPRTPPPPAGKSPAAPNSPERLEGLVGPEVPETPPLPFLGDRDAQLGVDNASLTHSAVARFYDSKESKAAPASAPAPRVTEPTAEDTSAQNVAWSAASSSIPSLRPRRREDDPVASAAVAWEEAELAAAAVSPKGAVGPLPPANAGAARLASPLPARRPARTHPLIRKLKELPNLASEMFVKLPNAVKIGAAAAVIVIPAMMWALAPKEHFISVAKVRASAQQLDGQQVHLRGTVGELFRMGGGYAFYLHQGRDTIVVFTTLRTPVENERIKLIGKVSTGYLDGQPRAAIFESQGP